jgi:hypothetical protein
MKRRDDDNELDRALRLHRDEPMALGPLFEPVAPRARASDPTTSHAAAASMLEPADLQRALIVHALRTQGPMTADELDVALDWRETTSGRRLAEAERQGRVRRTGNTRPTRSGRNAEIWEAA